MSSTPSPRSAPSPEAIRTLRCLACHASLARRDDALVCEACGQSVPIERGVARFLDATDSFYEGAYNRQIRFLPGAHPLKDWAYFHLVQSGVLGEIRRVLPPRGRVLDIGCAGGIRWLGRDALTVGLDLSVGSLAAAAEVYAGALQASTLDIPAHGGVFDVVYSSFVFEHLTREQKREALVEIHRVLAPGGRVVLQFDTLSSGSLYRFAQHDREAFHRAFVANDGHVGLAPLDDTIALFEPTGLTVQRAIKFGTTWVQYLPTYQWLDAAYAERFGWVRAVGRAARTAARSRLSHAWEFSVTALDRMLDPFVRADAATRAIVVAEKR
jgi:SAM-dependent methyltransferase